MRIGIIKSMFIFACLFIWRSDYVCSQTHFSQLSDTTFVQGSVFTIHNIRFVIGGRDILPESYPVLDSFALYLLNHRDIHIEIAHHSDSLGSNRCCADWSSVRAKSVANYLTEKGVDSNRIVAKGYGENQPNSVYLQKDTFSTEKPRNDLPFEKIVLTEAFINQFKEKDKAVFELLHQFNRRLEFKNITKLQDEHKDYFTLSDSTFSVGQIFKSELEFRFPICKPLMTWGDELGVEFQTEIFDSLKLFINAHPNLIFQIETHTDIRGSAEANQVLAERRAIEIGHLFIAKGVSNHQLRWKGIGEDKPVTVFLQNGNYFRWEPENNMQFEKIVLSDVFINQFKTTDKALFETFHQYNRRTEIKIVEIVRP